MSKHPTFAASILSAVLSPPATLAKLAARGMFASVPLNMPPDIYSANLQILFEGEVTTKSILEVYAPGDESGWAVVYKSDEDGKFVAETELVWGKWELVRESANYRGEPTQPDLDPKGETPYPQESAAMARAKRLRPADTLGIDLEDED